MILFQAPPGLFLTFQRPFQALPELLRALPGSSFIASASLCFSGLLLGSSWSLLGSAWFLLSVLWSCPGDSKLLPRLFRSVQLLGSALMLPGLFPAYSGFSPRNLVESASSRISKLLSGLFGFSQNYVVSFTLYEGAKPVIQTSHQRAQRLQSITANRARHFALA